MVNNISEYIDNVWGLYLLTESEGRIDKFLSMNKKADELSQAMASDNSLSDKDISPKDLLLGWEQQLPILNNYIQWVANQYSKGAFGAKDIESVANLIEKFQQLKNNKDLIQDPDLNKYSFGDLADKLQGIDLNNDVSKLGTLARKRVVKKAQNDIDLVYDGPNWFIVVPKSEAASRFWGRDTKWCTAADSENNRFNYYNSQGPLYIIVNQKNPKEKYQFHFESNQFNNAKNKPIDLAGFLGGNPEIKDFFLEQRPDIKDKMDKDNPRWWPWFNDNEITEDMKLEAVRSKGSNIQYINNPSEKLQELAIASDIDNVRYIQHPSEKIQLEALEKLSSIDYDYINNPTDRVKLAILRKDPSYIQSIEDPTEEMQLVVANTSPYYIKYVQNPTKNVQLAIAEGNPYYLDYIKNPCNEAIITALKNRPGLIGKIENPTEEMQLAAVEGHSWVIKDIKNPTEKVQRKVVEENPYRIDDIENPSEEVQLIAVQNSGGTIRYIKNPTEKVQVEALKDNSTRIQYIENPCEEAQLMFVNDWGTNGLEKYIKNPTEKVKQRAAEVDEEKRRARGW